MTEKNKDPVNVANFRPDIARSAVIYLEQEDPKRRHREKIVCAVNVGDFELRYPLSPEEPEKMTEDGRALRRKMWDEAVEALMQITAEAGLNPKFVRNDKNSCRFIAKQDSVSNPDQMPDEYFALELFYCSEFDLERRKLEHVKKLHQFEEDAGNKKNQVYSWKTSKLRKKELEEEIVALEKDRQFFLATTPDPREMDSGLIFKMELLTLKEYGVVKEKLKQILVRYLDALSKIASENGSTLPKTLRVA